MRLKLRIAYDGAAYRGWQSQPFRLTVQDFLEDALRRITGVRVVVHGAGRTDTGVHALGQGAHIDVPPLYPAREWQRILNHNLPSTIRIMQCQIVTKEFDARHSARGKIYRYRIRNHHVIFPHEADRVWMVSEKLDMDLLRAAAAAFVGTHDFRSFTVNRKAPERTIRHISRIQVTKRASLISITFCGEGFLYRMVRMLTGSMVRVAQGLDVLSTLEHRLQNPDAPEWDHVAPAGGLCLVKVLY